MCDSVRVCVVVFVLPWAQRVHLWVYFRHVWAVVCVTVCESEWMRVRSHL